MPVFTEGLGEDLRNVDEKVHVVISAGGEDQLFARTCQWTQWTMRMLVSPITIGQVADICLSAAMMICLCKSIVSIEPYEATKAGLKPLWTRVMEASETDTHTIVLRARST